MKGYVLGTAGLYSSALGWASVFSDANLFLHCANFPPSSILHCSLHWVSNPCKKKDCQENENLVKKKKKKIRKQIKIRKQ